MTDVTQRLGAAEDGTVLFRKKLSRLQFHRFMSEQPCCTIVMEACGGAHCWARETMRLGHDARLISARYVKPFIKRQKMEAFGCGRNFAAWLGLVPRQNSTGGKQRLGRTSKMGQQDIRRLLIIGAMAVVRWTSQKGARPGRWLARVLATKPRMLVAVALANKMARGIWAMRTRKQDYRDPGQPVAA